MRLLLPAKGAVPLSRLEKLSVRFRWFFSLVLGAFGVMSIIYLASNVGRDLKLLSSASSDNVQWTLSQAEVEFVDFEIYLATLTTDEASEIDLLRRHYDIFYSRIRTLKEATIYEELRTQYAFASSLFIVDQFLDQTVDIIDSRDAELVARVPELMERATAVRSHVRKLSNSGLNYFARDADMRRKNVSITLIQMAVGVTTLVLALVMLSFYLNRLNRVNIRRRTEVIEASHRMKIVTETALDAVMISNSDGKILYFNAAAEQIFGYSAEEAIGHDLGALIVPDHHRAAHEAGMVRMRTSGEKRVVGKGRVQLEAKRKSGDIFPVEFAIQSAETQNGEIFIAFLRDISNRKKAERELVAARDLALAGEKAKTDFLATMSHEIRTPLNGLLGNLTLLKETRLSAKQGRYIKNMDTSGKLLMSHISDVLDITKYDAGKLRLRPVAMNVSLLLQDIIDNQSGAALSNDTSLEWRWIGDPINWIRADKDRIQHVLMNVIGNAVKFTQDGRVSIELEVSGDRHAAPELLIVVSDTGRGMSEELQKHVFDDFTTGDSSYDRDVGGTGLGLGIAKRFVTALGGEIDVESTLGKGSTFSIHFPIEPIAAPDTSVKMRKTVGHAKPSKILLVEDNEINRFVACELLTAAGHHVTEAHNGREAVEMAEKQQFDLIFMDISMPVMDGREATRMIRRGQGANVRTPIVALTANAMAEEQETFLTDGMNDILTKPLSREDLFRVVVNYSNAGQVDPLPAQTAPVAIATAYLDDLRETLGVEQLQPLLDRYAMEIEGALADLAGGTAMPLTDVAQLAHRLAGSSASLGATDMRAGLLAIEAAAKEANESLTKQLIKDLKSVWEITRPLLRGERRETPRD